MNKIKIFLCVVASIAFINCETKERFPLSKRYWDVEDYKEAANELRFGYKSDEKLPTFDNPETRLIVTKLTDKQNFMVVLNDPELGLSYKNEIATDFFESWRILVPVYNQLDRKDIYIYDKELLAVYQFGMALQLQYFKLGNEQIKANSDDPNSPELKTTLNSNINILANNYLNYLDFVNEENQFSEQGKKLYAEGIEMYFTELINLYPQARYENMQRKVDLLLKKVEATSIKTALINLNELLVENINRKKEKDAN